MAPNVVTVIFEAKDRISKQLSNIAAAGKKAFATGRKAAVTGTLIALPFVVAGKAAVDFEEKMADVGKTTGLQGKDLTKFGDDLLNMSTKTRTSVDDLAAIAEIGGQLGIAQSEMLQFTDSANKFNIALGSDFAGGVEEAVTTIGKMKTLFKDTRDLNISEAIMRTGSAINELGAVGAATSANISDFSLRMGALPDNLKSSASATLAMGAYLEEMGIDSQIASSGLSNLTKVASANLGGFAKQMGVSAAEAKKLFAEDPSKFIAQFAQSLNGLSATELSKKMSELKIGSLEMTKVLGALSSDQVNSSTGLTRLAELYGISSKAMEKNTSLTNEAAKKEKTSAAQMAKLRNNLKALAITVGNALLPVINNLAESLGPMLKSAGEWMKRNKGLVMTIVKVGLALSAVAYAVSGISFVVGGLQKVLSVGTAAMKLFGLQSTLALGPLGLIVGAIALVAGGIMAYAAANNTYATSENLANEVREEALSRTREQRVEIQQHFDTLRRAKEGTDQYKNALAAIEQIQPGITEKYNLQKKSLDALNAAEKESIALIMEKMKAEVARESAKSKLVKAQEIKDSGIGFWDQVASFGANMATGKSLSAKQYQDAQVKNLEGQAEFLYGQASTYDKNAANMAESPSPVSPVTKNQIEVTINTPEGTTATATSNGKVVGTGNGKLKPIMGTTK